MPSYHFTVAGWGCSSCGAVNVDGTHFCGYCGVPRAEAEPGSVEERRLVTCLFADISGFTTLADRLDDEERLHEVIAPVVSGLAAIAERYEGFIAKYAGDALLVFFGAPVAHEDDATRALLVALEMHAALPDLVGGLPKQAHGLELHVGVNSGKVVSGRFGGELRSDYSILGDSVILAQRLESIAPAGETYVGETTRALTRDEFEFEYLGQQQLKGKTRPVPAWRLIGRVGTPAMTDDSMPAPRSIFVGRNTELTVMERLLVSGGVAGIVGEPGVGKSRLLQETQGMAAAQGVRWLSARCISYGAALAYFPYADLVRQVLGIRVEDPTDVAWAKLVADPTVSAATAPLLGRLIGASTQDDAVTTLDPGAFRREVTDGFAAWLRALARRKPIVLAIEDVHWSDSASLALTAALAASARDTDLRLVLTARPEGGEAVGRVVGAAEEADQRVLHLQPLDGSGVQALVTAVLGGDPPVGLADQLAKRTGGNPLFVQEVVRALQDEGSLFRRGGHWTLRATWDPDAVPDSIERVLSARIDLLPGRVAAVLATAAVIGRLVRLPLLRAVAEDEADLIEALHHLVRSGFLNQAVDAGEEALLFHHALVQEVAYGRLLRRHRRELHLRVADEAEAIYGDGDDVVDLLARHLYLGEAGPRAVLHLERAGRRARRMFANEEAILHLGRAMEVAGAAPELHERVPGILLEVAELQALRGDYDEALRVYRDARSDWAAAEAWVGEATVLRHRGRYDDALALVDEAFATLGQDSAHAPALCLERGWTLSLAGRYGDARDALHAGLGASGEIRDRVAGHLLAQLAYSEIMNLDFEAALDHANAARGVFAAIDDLPGVALALRIIGQANREMGRLDAAVVATRQAVDVAQRVGAVELAAGCLINLGMDELGRGNLEEALVCDRLAVRSFERLVHGAGRATAYGNLAEKLLLAGELEEAALYCSKALEVAGMIGHAITVADVHHTMARLHMRQGDHSEAAAIAERAACEFLELRLPQRAVPCFHLAADALTAAGNDERARDLSHRARSLEQPVG